MSAMDKVKGAREVEALETRIASLGLQVETLTGQLAELGDEAHAFMDELRENSERHAQDWNESQAEAAAMWERTVAQRIEPLGQSMARLSDEARSGVALVEQSSRQQAGTWLAAQQTVEKQRSEVAQEWRAAAQELREASVQARLAARGWHGWMWVWVAFAGMAPIGVLLIVSTLWLPLGWTLVAASNGDLYLLVLQVPPTPEPATEPATQ